MTAAEASIDLYYWPTPNGWKISIMLEECGLPYNLKLVDIGRGDQFKPEFLAISPNNRMPAIVDRDGPGGKPISVFESGAILQYLARKTGSFGGSDERAQVSVAEWLFWQVGNLGPMLGQANHFLRYAPERIPYAAERYVNEANRLYGVMNKRLETCQYLAGDFYSIADIACVGWAKGYKSYDQKEGDFPHFMRWLGELMARPAVQRGLALDVEGRRKSDLKTDAAARAVMFGQRAR